MRESPLFKELVQKAQKELEFLADKPEEAPESTIAALWCKAAGNPLSVEAASEIKLPPLNDLQRTFLLDLYKNRQEGIPIQHLTGRQRFVDIELLTGPEALIPRKETEILGRTVIDIAKQLAKVKEKSTILDVCTGAGNIACLLAIHFPNAFVYASDLSPEAVDLAQRNARFLNVADRMEFRTGDLLKPFEEGKFYNNIDLLTCNPPYISSTRVDAMNPQIINHEPRLAFDGGPFGVKLLQGLISYSPRFLMKDGYLAFEVGLGQGELMARRLEKIQKFSSITTIKDSKGEVRVLTARAR
jgi:release factor glutamine methyltransferase